MLRGVFPRARSWRSTTTFRRGFASRAGGGGALSAVKPDYSIGWQPIPPFQNPKNPLQILLNQSSMPQVPLTQAYNVPPPTAEIVVSGDVKVSKLPNGVRVATRDFQTPVASVGVFVNVGSRDESAENSGATHFLETAAFASTRTRTDFRLIRDCSRLGSSLSVSAGRETIAYTGEVLANFTRPLTETLCDIVKRPVFIDFELRDLVHHYIEETEHRQENHYETLLEQLHGAAYGYKTLGNPFFVPRHNYKLFKKPDTLKAFHSQFFTADRITLAAVGVPHEYFLELAQQEFEDMAARPTPRAAATYTGGDQRMHAVPSLHTPFDDHNAHIALAWQADGWTSPSVAALHVLSALMGGTRSALWSSAPNAARHVQTRLNRLVAGGVASKTSSFASVFSDSSLFGVYAQARPDHAKAAADGLVAEVVAVASGNVSAVELARAKLAAKSNVLWATDNRAALLDVIGRQLVLGDQIQTPQQIAALIDQVNPAALQSLAQRLLKTQLTLAASGDLTGMPRYDQIVPKL